MPTAAVASLLGNLIQSEVAGNAGGMANVLAGLANGRGGGGLNGLISQFEQAGLLAKGAQPAG